MKNLKIEKLNIHVLKLGYFPFDIRFQRVKRWHSKLFDLDCREVPDALKTLHKKDGNIYKDKDILEAAKRVFGKDNYESDEFTIVVTNVDLEDGDISRILNDNMAVISYREVAMAMCMNNIPLENMTLVLIYMYSLLFLRFKRIPSIATEEFFLHMDVRGCIFDYDDHCVDMVQCCDKPIICKQCKEQLNTLNEDVVETAEIELKRIRKSVYYCMVDLMKEHFYISFLMTIWLAVFCSSISTAFTGVRIFILLGVPVFLLIISFIADRVKKGKNKNW